MIAAWMAYAFVIATLVSAAALIAERIMLLRRLPSRWVWVSALLLSIALPVIFAQQSASPTEPAARLVALAANEVPPIYARSPITWVASDGAVATRRVTVDNSLLAGWAAMTALAIGIFAMGWLQLRRRLRSAVAGELNGVTVAITHDVGPAVVGVRRPRIVVPRWLLQQDAATQATALAHEQEHVRAHDIRVLGGALLIAVLLPWNLPVWWQLRRLRFAMEVDCDARVLRAGHSPSAYSTILLNVATQLVPLRAAAAGLSESSSSLEKRIRIIHTPLRRRWRLLAGFLAACSAALIAVAGAVAAPPALSPTANQSDGNLPLLPSPVAAQTNDEAMLARAVTYFYPQLTEPQDGRPYVWAVVNEEGAISQIDLDIHPAWFSDAEFARNWREWLAGHGVSEAEIRQELVMQIPIGRNYAVVAWVMQPGAVPQDAAAPAFELASKQARTMQARMLATVEAQRRVIEHFDPTALSEGVPAGQELWFLIDADGKVERAGRRTTITDPVIARMEMQKMFPGISVSYVTRGTAAKDALGKRIPVSWQWMEVDSDVASLR
jgi:beta-lactamase regulating signal transducer with metallopeptidase domain